MLSNPGFVNKAPKAKVEEEQEKLKNYKEMLEKVEEKLKQYCNKKNLCYNASISTKVLCKYWLNCSRKD